jgi:ABC-type polysaccharide/polyol phosphate transport system ATPase subunit
VIEARDLWKSFPVGARAAVPLLQKLRALVRREPPRAVEALRGVSFEVGRGERVGLVGTNGSGKTTLLRVVAGIYRPDRGTVRTKGRLATCLQLGIGLIHLLDVRQNVYLYGALMGLGREQVRRRYDAILDFAGLREFEQVEVRQLSSGMIQRLTFSIAMQVDAEVLLLDEALAVGDQEFKNKCYDWFEHGLPKDRTVLFASHDLREIERFCPRTLWLERGAVAGWGDTAEVLRLYQARHGWALDAPALTA